MMSPILQRLRRWLSLGLLMLILGISGLVGWTQPAIATIRQLEERPGQVVYQARHRLTDQEGRFWQAVAYKRTYPDKAPLVHVRLVTSPGAITLTHPHPLILRNSLGNVETAPDVSAGVSTETERPANLGEYDLQAVLPKLQAAIPLTLNLATEEGATITLPVPSRVIQEWQQVQTQ